MDVVGDPIHGSREPALRHTEQAERFFVRLVPLQSVLPVAACAQFVSHSLVPKLRPAFLLLPSKPQPTCVSKPWLLQAVQSGRAERA